MHGRMRIHHLALVAGLLAPGLAHGGGVIEGFWGIARPPAADFESAVSGAQDPHVFKDSLQNAGGDLLIDLRPLELGAIVDLSWANDSASLTALGALLGFKLDVAGLRLDLLGEVGGHRFGNFAKDPAVITSSDADEWLAYVGLRPGIAVQLGKSRGLLLGVWTFARWDLTTQNVPLTVSGVGGAATDGTVKLGGTSIGATLRVGYAF